MVAQAVGDDGGKKIKGRKRFTLVDTLGLLIAVRVVAANVPELEGAKQLLNQLNQERHRVPRLTRIWVDGGFSGEQFLHWSIDTFRWILEVVSRPQGTQGFVLLPKSAPTVGCIGAVASMWIMRGCRHLQKRLFTLQ